MNKIETADWLEYAQGAMANGATFLALFWTIVSGYLVVAVSTGERLLRSQVSFINSLFIVSTAMCTFAATLAASNGLLAVREAATSLNQITALTPSQANAVVVIAIVINSAIILGCLKFMWDVRHPRNR